MGNIYKNRSRNIESVPGSIYSGDRADDDSSALYKSTEFKEQMPLNEENPHKSPDFMIKNVSENEESDITGFLQENSDFDPIVSEFMFPDDQSDEMCSVKEEIILNAKALSFKPKDKNRKKREQKKEKIKTIPEHGDSETNERKCKPSAYLLAVEMSSKHSYTVQDNQLHRYMENEGFWKIITENQARYILRHDISAEDRCSVNKYTFAEIYDWLLADSPELPALDNKYWLNFSDVAFNWKTGETTTDRKDLYFTYKLNLEYSNLSENNGYYSRFIHDVFKDDKDTIREFKKFLGLCLSNIRNLNCFFLYGPSNTGKSVILNVLKLLIGEDYCSSVSFSQMSNEFAITQLIGKRLNISGEVSGTTNKRLDIFKSLTGNDRITASFKCKDHFQFSNNCLLTFACNALSPMISANDTDSFMSRIIIFPFRNTKPRSEWISNLEEMIFMDAKALIKDAIEGLKLLEEDSFRFVESKAMKKCKREFYLQNDSFTVFAGRYIKEESGNKVSSKDIATAYTHFCHVEECPALNQNQWGPVLKMKYNAESKTLSKRDENGEETRLRCYKGIRLNYPYKTDEFFE
ncbi:MAG: phage/plasmid primase, P4 family [Porcipelethomonas sp.]